MSSFAHAQALVDAWATGRQPEKSSAIKMILVNAVASFVDGSKVYRKNTNRNFHDDYEVYVVGINESFSMLMPTCKPHDSAVRFSNVKVKAMSSSCNKQWDEKVVGYFSDTENKAWLRLAGYDDLGLAVIAVSITMINMVMSEGQRGTKPIRREKVPLHMMTCLLTDPEVVKGAKKAAPHRKYNFSGMTVHPSKVLEMIKPIGDVLEDCKTCLTCGKESVPGKMLKRCGACRVAGYCGIACQRQHWKIHKKECCPYVSNLTMMQNLAMFTLTKDMELKPVSYAAIKGFGNNNVV